MKKKGSLQYANISYDYKKSFTPNSKIPVICFDCKRKIPKNLLKSHVLEFHSQLPKIPNVSIIKRL